MEEEGWGGEGADAEAEEAEEVEAVEAEEAAARGREGQGGGGGGGGGGGEPHLLEMAARHDIAILVVSVLPAPLSPLTRMDCAPPGKLVSS